MSSAYHSESNGRAEVCVKAMKRLLRDNIDSRGRLNTDAIMRGMLQLRNTPEADSGLSPAQILFGRTLKDCLPLCPPIPRQTTIFDDSSPVSPVWKDMWSAKENALRQRLATQVESLEAHSHDLKPLVVGDPVRVQNQHGPHSKKWDRTGVIMQVGEHDQYIVRMDGSRRLTLRNRRYLRKIKPYDSRLFGTDPPSVSYNPVHTTVLGKEVVESTKSFEKTPQRLHHIYTSQKVDTPESSLDLPDVSPALPAECPLPPLPEPVDKGNQSLQPALGPPPPAITVGQGTPEFPSDVGPRRSQRERRQPDWYKSS